MKKLLKIFSFIFCTAVFLLPTDSFAFAFSLLGAANYSTPTTNNGGNYKSKAALGYGAGFEFSLLPMVRMEIDAINISRKYENSTTSTLNSYEQKMWEVPLILRLWLGRHLSVGLGAYYAKYTGEVNKNSNPINGGAITNTKIAYAGSSYTKDDYGLLTSIGLYFTLIPGVKIIAEGRYTMGLRDNDTSSAELKFNDVQAITGLRVGF